MNPMGNPGQRSNRRSVGCLPAMTYRFSQIFVVQVLEEPHPKAETVLFYTKDWPAAAVAVMNVVYAFSGQSAYVEIIAEMKGPHRFPSSLAAATSVMVVAYLGIGIAGYVSQVRRCLGDISKPSILSHCWYRLQHGIKAESLWFHD